MASIALHATGAQVLASRASSVKVKTQKAVAFELQLGPPSPPPKEDQPRANARAPAPRAPSLRRPASLEAASSEAETPQGGGQHPAPHDAPVAERRLESILPPLALSGRAEPPQGVTLHPGDGVVPDEVARAEEAEQARQRVQGFAEDLLAEARAGGGINPYFEALGHALAVELSQADGGSPVQLGVTDGNAGLKKSYATAASSYGRTGDPGFAPPGRVPTQTEQLKASDAPLALQAMAQARETAHGLATLTPLLSLKLELRQTPRGALLQARVVESSGNVRFDSFVMRVAPDALPKVGVAPQARGAQLRSVFRVDGWLRRHQSPAEQVARAVAPLAMGIPIAPFVDVLAVTDPALADFEYRATLLRAY